MTTADADYPVTRAQVLQHERSAPNRVSIFARSQTLALIIAPAFQARVRE